MTDISRETAAAMVGAQRRYFETGRTRDLAYRKTQLRKLKAAVRKFEPEILAALAEDLGKPAFEAYASEIGFVYEEIGMALRQLDEWAAPVEVATPLTLVPAHSRILREPRGVVLIIGPWNYPFQLVITPLVAAVAAGCCAVLKPSELARATSRVLARMMEAFFSPEACAVVEGGVPTATHLLAERWDHIFFTGGENVAKVVLRAAAEHLTPVTLELGGKSPCLVDQDTDPVSVARRLVWGKFLNCGQTCIAPDYVLVHSAMQDRLLAAVKAQIKAFYGDDPRQSPDYGRIISQRHFDRLVSLMNGATVLAGGRHDRADLYLEPTVLGGVGTDAPAMREEIFGPILPVLPVKDMSEALAFVKARPQPLACYVFTGDRALEQRVLTEVQFGGGCVNNTLLHFANPHLPFGGVGPSGMGAYHGRAGFEVFTHRKSVVRTPPRLEVKIKYPPYKGRLALLRRLMR